MKKVLLLSFLSCWLAACGGAKYYVRGDKAAPLFENERVVYIVQNDATKKGFLSNMQSWLSNHAYRVEVVSAPVNASVPYLTYVARWSWDGGIFLADATVKAFSGGTLHGSSMIKVPNNFNFSKYGDTEGRIDNLMSLLFFHKTENAKQINVTFEVE